MLTCGPPSLSSVTPKGKGEGEESCSDDDSGEDEENQTVCKFIYMIFDCASHCYLILLA